MNNLIALSQISRNGRTVEAVNARSLHSFLQVKTAFKDWTSRRIVEYGFCEGSDFCSFLSESFGGRPRSEYAFSLGMAKELCMVENNERGKMARLASRLTFGTGTKKAVLPFSIL